MSAIELAACGRRSSDLGVITISGRCLAMRAWRRSRWKYWAGVVGLATRMLPSAASAQEALQARGGVLGARALVAVGQQQRQARGLAPLGEAGDDELVDDHLGGVDEVAELRLPQHERLGGLLAVAVLEAHARELRERAVVQLQRRQRVGQALDRADRLAGLGVVQDHVALAEGAALGVLAGEPQRCALGQQRRERERLRVRPVDHGAPPLARAPRGGARAV